MGLGLTQEHNNVCLDDKLSLRRAMDVGNASVLGLMHQRWSAYVIPHLTRYHGKAEEQSNGAPYSFVVQEFEIIATYIEEAGHQRDQRYHSHCARVVWWPENSNCDIGTFSNKFGNGIRGEANTMYIHGISTFGFTLRWEMHENWRRIQAQHLKDIGTFVEINHCEE